MTRAPQALAQPIRPTMLAGSHAFSRGGMGLLHKIAALAVAATLAALCGIAAARAEVRVAGTADTVVVWAKAATLTDVVAGLEAASHARTALKGATSRQFTGIYRDRSRRCWRACLSASIIVHTAPDRITIVLMTPDAGHPCRRGGDPGRRRRLRCSRLDADGASGRVRRHNASAADRAARPRGRGCGTVRRSRLDAHGESGRVHRRAAPAADRRRSHGKHRGRSRTVRCSRLDAGRHGRATRACCRRGAGPRRNRRR